jgi:uncharacterized circularly permuted ATP-grasp superfamily protein
MHVSGIQPIQDGGGSHLVLEDNLRVTSGVSTCWRTAW